jgi:O-antigen/teichoic acid export membrane protein
MIAAKATTDDLLSRRRLQRNVVWNVVGAGVPLFVAVWAIPQLVKQLGTERFGMVGLIWAGVGYFGLFDMGFGRALTKLVAQRLGEGRDADVANLVRTAMTMLAGIGTVVGAVLAIGAPWFVNHVLSTPDSLKYEATVSFRITCLALPAVMCAAALSGVLQAYQRFGRISVVQATLGIITFAGPLAALQISRSLVSVAAVLAGSRMVGCAAYVWFCRHALRPSSNEYHRATVRRELATFGGWVAVSNIVGPLMTYLDRFVIAALVTVAAVSYYTTAYEMVTRFWVLADATVAVAFPAIATALARGNGEAPPLFERAIRATTLLMIVPIGLVLLFAPEILGVWLGPDFARASSTVLRWLALGVFVNSIARLPFAAIQAGGRPDVTAKIHLIELPGYVVALFVLVRWFGIDGAAVAWTVRIVADTAILCFCVARMLPELRPALYRVALRILGPISCVAGLLPFGGLWLRGFAAIGLGGWAVYEFYFDRRKAAGLTSVIAA